MLFHQMSDAMRAQRLDTRTWTFCVVAVSLTVVFASLLAGAEVCVPTKDRFLPPLFLMAAALVNGTHGLGFAHKIALMGIVLFVACTFFIAMCPDSTSAIVIALCQAGAIGVGAAVARLAPIRTHTRKPASPSPKPRTRTQNRTQNRTPKPGVTVAHVVELHMRQSYKDKQLLLEQSTQTQQLEERNEQLQAEKERLLYDNALQRLGRTIEDDDNRSAICRGLQAVPPSLPPGPPSSRSSSVDSEQFAAEALTDMANDTSGSSAAAEARQSADSFTVEVVEPQEACTMQAQAASRSTTGPAGDDATPVTAGKMRAADNTVRQTPSLPPLILGANTSLPAGLGLVQAEAQRFWNRVDPSNGESAVGVAGCSSSSSAQQMAAALSGSSSSGSNSSGAQQMAQQSFTYASWPVRRLLGQQQSFGHVPIQNQQTTIPSLGQLQQQQPAAAPWLSQPQLPQSPEQAALERLLRAHTTAQQLPRAVAATCITLEEKFMKYVMCDYTPRWASNSYSPNPNPPLHPC